MLRFGDYVVDIGKAPIGPPNRTIRTGFFGDRETTESIERTKNWNLYIEAYRSELKKSRGK